MLSCNAFANQTAAATACAAANKILCPSTPELEDDAFYAVMIDALARKLSVNLDTVSTDDIRQATVNANCALGGRVVYAQSDPLKNKALLAYLVNQAVCTL